jgi:hypothetical protein
MTTGVVYASQSPSAPTAYCMRSTPDPPSASVARMPTLADPTYCPCPFRIPLTSAVASGGVVSSPLPSVTTRMPCMDPWPGMVQW